MDNLKDSAISKNALEFIDDFLTPEERIKSDLRVAFIGELIKARQEKGLCQKNGRVKRRQVACDCQNGKRNYKSTAQYNFK